MRAIRQSTGPQSSAPQGNDPQAAVPAQPGNGQADDAAAAVGGSRPAYYRIDWDGLRTAGRACCCPAKPVVIVVIPPAPGREHRTDLLLCMHHFRVSRSALNAARASVVDVNLKFVPPDAPAYLPA